MSSRKNKVKGTPVAVKRTSTLERLYNFPPKCRDKHTWSYGRVFFTFIESDYLPYPMYGLMCIYCGEIAPASRSERIHIQTE